MRSPDQALLDAIRYEVITADVYELHRWDHVRFTDIIDVGANVGVFSLAARIRFPGAQITAIEGRSDLAAMAASNLDWLDVRVINAIVGAGKPVTPILRDKVVNEGCRIFGVNEGGTEASQRLLDLVGPVDPRTTMVKIDIEGGESELFGDPATRAFLTSAHYVTAEIHTGPIFTAAGLGWPSLQKARVDLKAMFDHHDFRLTVRRGVDTTGATEATGMMYAWPNR